MLPSPARRERAGVRVIGADKREGYGKQPQPIIQILPNPSHPSSKTKPIIQFISHHAYHGSHPPCDTFP